jgi:nitroreductase
MRRRAFVKGAGAVTIAFIGGAVWRAYDAGVFSVGEGPAYEPWKHWRAEARDGPLALVRAAILASNPFNTQPWLFRVTDSWIEVYADNRRNTGAFDPYLRELRIGIGCAIENLMLAAPANGYRATLVLNSGTLERAAVRPARDLVARVELTTGPREVTELYAAIPRRHTNRNPFDAARPLPAGFADALRRLADDQPDVAVQLFSSSADKTRFVEICTQSVLDGLGDVDAREGTARWERDWKSLQVQHDGSSIDDAGLPPLTAAAMKVLPSRIIQLFQPRQTTDITKLIKTGYTDLLATGQLFGLIAVRDVYDQEQSIRAGRVWQRSHLLATARGLAARPANQPVQLVDRERSHARPPREAEILTTLTHDAAWKPTFMFFMGYPTRPANASARRGVGEVVI